MSKEIFEKNDEVFFKEYQRHLPEYKENPAYKIIKSNNGKDIIQIHLVNEIYLRMSSLYDPEYEASRWAAKYYDDTKNTILAIYGFGNYYYIKTLVENSREDDRFVIYEPNEDFFSFICYNFDISDIIATAKVFFVLPSMPEDTFSNSLLYCTPLTGNANILGITMPTYSSSEEFTATCEKVALIRDSNKGFINLFGKQSVLNCLSVVNKLPTNYSLYDFKKMINTEKLPVIVVAAGPSLLENGSLLKKFENRALIISVDRAAKVLRELDVRPHFISTVDPNKPLSMMAREDVKDIPVLCDPNANMKIQEMYEGQLMYTGEDSFFQRLPGYKHKTTPGFGDSGGSVATWSYNVAVVLGAKTVILVGQDLAMKEGFSHADGTRKEDESTSEHCQEIDGINGEKVLARNDWIRFRDFYEDAVKRNPDVRLIDATEGGALIHGSEVMTLQEVLDTVCTETFEINNTISNMPHAQDSAEAETSHKYMQEIISSLSEIKKDCNEAKKICDQLRRLFAYHKPHDQYMIKKLQAFNKYKDKIYEYPIFDKLQRYSVQNSDMIPAEGHDIMDDKDGQAAFEQYIVFLNDMIIGSDELKEELEKMYK